jgi:hypothetical protein
VDSIDCLSVLEQLCPHVPLLLQLAQRKTGSNDFHRIKTLFLHTSRRIVRPFSTCHLTLFFLLLLNMLAGGADRLPAESKAAVFCESVS